MAEITFRDLKNMRAFKELPILTRSEMVSAYAGT